jgi:hypothetical protein
MATEIILSRESDNFLEIPFSAFPNVKEDKCDISGGKIIPVFSDDKDFLVRGKRGIPLGDKKEIYLRIKSKPLTNKIERAEFLNEEQVIEEKRKSDDLLNIYLPISLIGENNTVKYNDLLNGNFNWTKTNDENPLSGYFQDGKIYLTGCLVLATQRGIIKIQLNQDISAKEGDFLFIKTQGHIRYKGEGTTVYQELYLEEISFSVGGEGDAQSKLAFQEGEIESGTNFSVGFSYPIGYIDNGNYMTLKSGNFQVALPSTRFYFFNKKVENETGCAGAEYLETRYINLLPRFL